MLDGFRRRGPSSPCRPLGGRCRAKRGGRGAQRPARSFAPAALASAEQTRPRCRLRLWNSRPLRPKAHAGRISAARVFVPSPPPRGEAPRKARRRGGSASRRPSARGGARVCGTARLRCPPTSAEQRACGARPRLRNSAPAVVPPAFAKQARLRCAVRVCGIGVSAVCRLRLWNRRLRRYHPCLRNSAPTVPSASAEQARLAVCRQKHAGRISAARAFVLSPPPRGEVPRKARRKGGSASRAVFRPRRRSRPRNSAPAAVPCLRSRNRHGRGVPSALVEQPPAASESACWTGFGGARLRPLAAPSGGGAAQSAAEGGLSVPRGLPPPAAQAGLLPPASRAALRFGSTGGLAVFSIPRGFPSPARGRPGRYFSSILTTVQTGSYIDQRGRST